MRFKAELETNFANYKYVYLCVPTNFRLKFSKFYFLDRLYLTN